MAKTKRSTRGRRSGKSVDSSLLVATAKAAFVLDRRGEDWRLSKPILLGSRINDVRLDPRDGRTMLVTATGGHLGPTVYRSRDRGESLEEATRPPAFKKAAKKGRKEPETTRGKSVRANFWLTPGHPDEPGVWYLGTVPQGLFRSEDEGLTWKGVKGLNENEDWKKWVGPIEPPEGGFLHSVRIDPRDARHLYVSMSAGGTFESRDRGRSWRPLNLGLESDFMPDEGDQDYGQDPHNMILHPADPDILYQQNHCGLYRMDRRVADRWERIGRRMPGAIGDWGFVVAGHPRDPMTIWTVPMDGSKLWPRTSPEGRPAVYVTRDGGESFARLDRGLPPENAWFVVKRQCLCLDDASEPNLFFGTTSGEIWMGRNGGEEFGCIARHLPPILALATARFR